MDSDIIKVTPGGRVAVLSFVAIMTAAAAATVLVGVHSASAAECAKDTSFKLYDLSDRIVSSDQLRAAPETRMLVVDFFSMACAPCKRAMPRLAELAKQYSPQGLRVVVVAIPANGSRDQELEKIKLYFEPLGVTFPVVFDKYSVVAKQFGVTDGKDAKLPQSFVVAPKGGVEKRFEDMESLISEIESRFGKVDSGK